jgi:ABC-2 type transport system ATP-binding protein
MEESGVVLAVRNSRDFFPKLQSAIASGRLSVKSIDPLDMNLDAVFQYLTQDHG